MRSRITRRTVLAAGASALALGATPKAAYECSFTTGATFELSGGRATY